MPVRVAPEHLVWLVGEALTVGTGLMITVTVVVDEQEPVVAVTVNVAVCCTLVVLASVPLIEEPVPPEAMPVRLLLLLRVQVKVVPGTLLGLVMLMVLMARPEQSV
jgi:hypothetical protein